MDEEFLYGEDPTKGETLIDVCNKTEANTNQTSYTVVEIVLIAIVTVFLSLMTIIGNILVIVSFKMDKKLQTLGNYYLISLAVADFIIGLVSMPLFTLYTLMEGWFMGPIVCDCWLALDYLCSNASVLNLLMISFDRYFAVTNPLQYRAKRTGTRVIVFIALAWILSFFLWPPWILLWPYIEGKRSVPDDKCYIQFLETNFYVTIVTAVLAFYVPVAIMVFLYFKIWLATERSKKEQAHLHAENRSEVASPAPACNPASELGEPAGDVATTSEEMSSKETASVFPLLEEKDKKCIYQLRAFLASLCSIDRDEGNDDDSPSGTTPSSSETPNQSSRTTSMSLRPEQIAQIEALSRTYCNSVYPVHDEEGMFTIMINMPENERASVKQIPDGARNTPVPMRSSRSTSALIENSLTNQNMKRCSSSEALSALRLGRQARPPRTNVKKNVRDQDKKSDSKAAKTLSAILLAFILTWTPYNVLVLIKGVEALVSCQDIIPQVIWDFSYYLCYMNSMFNPLCYALANANFRKTYWRILTCTWERKSKLSIIRGLHSRAS